MESHGNDIIGNSRLSLDQSCFSISAITAACTCGGDLSMQIPGSNQDKENRHHRTFLGPWEPGYLNSREEIKGEQLRFRVVDNQAAARTAHFSYSFVFCRA
jgi:hypothetical protein